MKPLFSVDEILAATGGHAKNVTAASISNLSIDSRDIEAGALFVAILGDRFDGHDFVTKALDNGAAIAVVSAQKASGFSKLPIIVVPDPLEAMVRLAEASRARSRGKIIAVTGSVGKTTTKQALSAALMRFGKTHASIKSFNNHWGVPLMLARMPEDTDFGVFEIGMSASGEITPLTNLVRPDIAVITAIAAAHLESLGSLAAVAKAKAEIFSGVSTGGLAIVNGDHDHLALLRNAALNAGVGRFVSYGFADGADVRIVDARVVDAGMQARILWPDMEMVLTTGASGRHQLANAVAVMCVARELALDLEQVATILAQQRAPEGRGAVLHFGPPEKPLTIIDETYNGNPASMLAALEVFAGMSSAGGRKILVLGDMLELGAASDQLHGQLVDPVMKCATQQIFLVGKHMRVLAGQLAAKTQIEHVLSIEDIEQSIVNSLDYGDIVMIKGSNSVRLGVLISKINTRFGSAQAPNPSNQ